MKNFPKVIIVGGGFAGLRAAQGLKNCPCDIILIDKSNHHLFQPLLYQVATATLSPADIATPIRSVLRKQKNVEVLMAEVQGIDKEKKQVILPDRNLDYDYLVLATGATHSYFGKEEWEEEAPGLKSISDATKIRQRILVAFEKAEMDRDPLKKKKHLTFILVGGGPTGVEMAGAIGELAKKVLASDFKHIDPRQARVLLIEAGPRILMSFPESLSKSAENALKNLGVEVKLNARVENIKDGVVYFGSESIESSTILWTAGVMASPASRWLSTPADRVGRVFVNEYLQLPTHKEIYIGGDTAHCVDKKGPLPGVAPVAMQQGRYIAKKIKSEIEKTSSPEPFHYVDKGNLATIGRHYAVADINGFKLSGYFAWITWLVVHIFYLIGFRNRLLVLIEWAWAYVAFYRGARLITKDDD
jgi:NADH dehydrogenase